MAIFAINIFIGFKRRAIAVPNYIDRITKFDFSTAVARRLKPSRASAELNLKIMNTLEYI